MIFDLSLEGDESTSDIAGYGSDSSTGRMHREQSVQLKLPIIPLRSRSCKTGRGDEKSGYHASMNLSEVAY